MQPLHLLSLKNSTPSAKSHSTPSSKIPSNPLTNNKTPQSVIIEDDERLKEATKTHLTTLQSIKLTLPAKQDSFQAYQWPKTNSDLQRLKTSLKAIQTPKTLAKLDLTLGTNTSSDLHYALSKLKYLQNISRLNFNLLKEHHNPHSRFYNPQENLTRSNSKLLSQTLSAFKNLTSLHLKIPYALHSLSQHISRIFSAIKSLPYLSHLSLHFHSSWSSQDTILEQIALLLQNLPRLKSLKLYLRNLQTPRSSDQGLRRLSLALKNLPFLSNLDITIINQTQGVPVPSLNEFFQSLETLKSLTKISLDIQPDRMPMWTNPLSNAIKALNPHVLREISLDFDKSNSIDTCLTQLSQNLTKFSLLKGLRISFLRSTQVNTLGIWELASALKTLTSLSSLELHFEGLQSSILIEILSQSLLSLLGLTKLSFTSRNFQGKKGNSMRSLSSSLAQLKLLKQLSLNLEGCKFMDDEVVECLMDGLKESKKINSLELNLSSNFGITNKGIHILASSLTNFPNLKDLSLRLFRNNIDGRALESLAGVLGDLGELYSFVLVFCSASKNADNFENEGMKVLCHALKNLRSVKKISFGLKDKIPLSLVSDLNKVKSVTVFWESSRSY